MKLLTTDETSDFLGVPKATLAKMRWAGDGAPFIKIGRKVYYRPADLEEWLVQQTRTNTSQTKRE